MLVAQIQLFFRGCEVSVLLPFAERLPADGKILPMHNMFGKDFKKSLTRLQNWPAVSHEELKKKPNTGSLNIKTDFSEWVNCRSETVLYFLNCRTSGCKC